MHFISGLNFMVSFRGLLAAVWSGWWHSQHRIFRKHNPSISYPDGFERANEKNIRYRRYKKPDILQLNILTFMRD